MGGCSAFYDLATIERPGGGTLTILARRGWALPEVSIGGQLQNDLTPMDSMQLDLFDFACKPSCVYPYMPFSTLQVVRREYYPSWAFG
jgi:hypothetical protein